MGDLDISKLEKELESIKNLLILMSINNGIKVHEIAKACKMSTKTISKLFPQKKRRDKKNER